MGDSVLAAPFGSAFRLLLRCVIAGSEATKADMETWVPSMLECGEDADAAVREGN